MSPEVSRILAAVKAELNLDREQSRQLLVEYANVADPNDLPSWITSLYAVLTGTAEAEGDTSG